MKGDNIAERMLAFAAQVLQILSYLAKSPQATHVAKQLTRAATAGGANYEEARGAESRADFVHKVKVSCKEIREAAYWLRLIRKANLVRNFDLAPTIKEANELTAILSASAKTAKSR
jgi:four helix bundle protein